MRRGLSLSMSALASLLLFSTCSNNDSNTKIMVVVWSDLAIPTEMDSIHVDVTKGSSTSPSTTFPLTTGNAKLPVVMELVSPDNKGTTFEVMATGFLRTAPVVSQAASLSFDHGHSHVLTLFLARACREATCPAAPLAVDVTKLPEYDPKTPFLAPDAGVVFFVDADGGIADSGGVDVVADVGQTSDAALDNSVADARQAGDSAADKLIAVPDTGTETSADTPLVPDASSDTPSDPIVLDNGGEDLLLQDSTLACDPSTPGCAQVGDGATDTLALALDAESDAPGEPPDSLDASSDKPSDLIDTADTNQDLSLADGNSACVLPMTTCTGLCINPQTSAGNCGGCGRACGTQNGTPSCASAVCSMSSCSPGFFDCSANENTSRDGCETNGNIDSSNCGRCGNVCSSKVCRNQTCLATAIYGNIGKGSDLVNFTQNFLAGIEIYIPNPCVVTGLGVVLAAVSNFKPHNMYLGLYKDVAGNPGDLVATVSAPTLVAAGGQELSVAPPVDVLAGSYWILGVWDGLASFATNAASTVTVTWRYSAYNFGALPSTAPTSMGSLAAQAPNLYAIVAQ